MNDLDARMAAAKAAHRELGPDDEALARMLATIEAVPTAPTLTARGVNVSVRLTGYGLGLISASALLWRLLLVPASPATTPHSTAVVAKKFEPEAGEPEAVAPAVVAPRQERDPPERATPVRSRERTRPPDPAAELALLGRARRVLDADPARALALSDEHATRYPRGTLQEERELLAIEALGRLVKRGPLQKRVRRFIHSFPRSVHLERVQEIDRSSAEPLGSDTPSRHAR